MKTRSLGPPVAFVAFASLCAAASGCASNEPPKAPEPQPLVIGTSPPAPIAIDPKRARAEPDAIQEAQGSAPRVFLDSLTTPGKVYLPAGKVVVLHFWATWCGPCKQSFPKLQALYTKHRAKGLQVIAVSVDDQKDGIVAFARSYGAAFPIGWDDDHALALTYKVDSMPSTYVIDRKGTIVNTHQGYHSGQESELEREVGELL